MNSATAPPGSRGILRKENGEPAIRFWSRSAADTPNRFSVEFQDAFNEYQQDSLSLVDVDDVLRTGQEISVPLSALGIPNFHQAARIIQLQLDKSLRGNTYVQFETSVRGVGLKPGDLITLTYLKEGLLRQPFRIKSVVSGTELPDGRDHGADPRRRLVHRCGRTAASHGTRRQPGFEVGAAAAAVGEHSGRRGRDRSSRLRNGPTKRWTARPTCGSRRALWLHGGRRQRASGIPLLNSVPGCLGLGRHPGGRPDALLRGQRAGDRRCGEPAVLSGASDDPARHEHQQRANQRAQLRAGNDGVPRLSRQEPAAPVSHRLRAARGQRFRRYRVAEPVGGAARRELRSRELLLAAGTAARGRRPRSIRRTRSATRLCRCRSTVTAGPWFGSPGAREGAGTDGLANSATTLTVTPALGDGAGRDEHLRGGGGRLALRRDGRARVRWSSTSPTASALRSTFPAGRRT